MGAFNVTDPVDPRIPTKFLPETLLPGGCREPVGKGVWRPASTLKYFPPLQCHIYLISYHIGGEHGLLLLAGPASFACMVHL